MKCGTTNLFQVLAQHPEIAACREKEPGFFSNPAVFERGLDWYLQQWDWDPAIHKTALEASTGYTRDNQRSDIPQRIAAVNDRRFRFIYLMRHPLERIESHVRHGLYQGFVQTLDEVMKTSVIDATCYAEKLDRFMEYFPPERLLLITLEEFRQRPYQVLKRICRHIGISDDFKFKAARQPRNAGARYERPKIINWMAEGRLRPLVRLARATLPSKFKQQLKRLFMSKDRGRYRLTDTERRQILEILEPDLRRLQSVYGVEVRKRWGLNVGNPVEL